MAETTSHIEFAHKIHEQGHDGGGPHSHRQEWIEIVEAVVLAAVAVLTAWSSYQAGLIGRRLFCHLRHRRGTDGSLS